MSHISLLFLSGASLVGQNILSALAGRRRNLHLVALNSEAREPALYDFDEVWLAPESRSEPDRFQERFLQVIQQTNPELIIPCRDDDVLFLARMREEMPSRASRMICGSAATAWAMIDKWQSWTFSQAHGLPFVPTVPCDRETAELHSFAREHGFPLIAKPREGFASRDVMLLLNKVHLDKITGRPDYILQMYLGDREQPQTYALQVASEGLPLFHTFEAAKLSIQALIGPHGDCLECWSTRNLMRQGRSEFVSVIRDAWAIDLGKRCAVEFARDGWRGPLNIQCQVTPDGEAWIHEYNGRFTGATGARYLFGYDEVGMAFEAFGNLVLEPERHFAHRAVKHSLRGRPLEEDKIEVLLRDGIWRGKASSDA